MKQWTLVTPLRFLRGLLHALVLPATALAILAGGTLGGVAPLVVLDWLGARTTPLALAFGLVGGVLGVAGAYVAGDRLNERVRRLRAPIGSVAVGADGIRWRRLGKTAFVGWAEVRDIEQRAGEVALQVAGRAATVLRVREAGALATAARDALQRYREAAQPDTIAALELAGDDVSDWLGRARKLLEGGSYRDANVGEEHLVRVATDPRAAVAQRIGSAAALSNASEDARTRVRVAIEETANPVLANALEDALDGREDERAMRSAVLARGDGPS